MTTVLALCALGGIVGGLFLYSICRAAAKGNGGFIPPVK